MIAATCIGLSTAAAIPENQRMIDDFSTDLTAWTHKPNVALAVKDGVLDVRIDFTEYRYAWFRKHLSAATRDLSPFEGIAFRTRGAQDRHLLVHLMTGPGKEPTATYVTARPLVIRSREWTTRYIAWEEMVLEKAGTPLPQDALRHVHQINVSILARGADQAQLNLDDLRTVMLPSDARKALDQRLAYRKPIPGDRAFFDLLDFEHHTGLQSVRDALPDLPKAKTELLRYMRERPKPAYYFDPRGTRALADAIGRHEPTYPKSIIRSAEKLLTHTYTWEGETRRLTRPIDYRQKGREWSAVLNRFGFLTNVARAWWFTGREDYAEEVIGQMHEWAASCPVPAHGRAGRTWHPLEVGCRAHAWLKLYMSTLMSKSMTPEANVAILKSLAEHAHVLSDPALHGGAPNMIIVESTGLASLAIVFPEFKSASDWLERGLDVLNAELARRVLVDGAWEEVTPGYHSWVAHSCLGFAILAKRNGIPLPDHFTDRFRSMFEWTLKITKPNGRTPMLGDASDHPAEALMTEAALYFQDAEFRYLGRSRLAVGDLERFGTHAAEQYNPIKPQMPAWKSLHLPESKLFVMRTGYHHEDSYLLFDAGPIWSHTHQDTLGFCLYALGKTLLWDSGVCNYNLPECRKYYRQARAHNVVLIDQADMKLTGIPLVHHWKSTEKWDFADAQATFTGPDAIHRRQILFIKPHCWIIRDVIKADKPRTTQRLFHVREKAALEMQDGYVLATETNAPTLRIRPVKPAETTIAVSDGLITYHHGRGPGNNNLKAPVVILAATIPPGTSDLVTLLTVASETQKLPAVETRVAHEGLRITVHQSTEKNDILLPSLVQETPPKPVVTAQ